MSKKIIVIGGGIIGGAIAWNLVKLGGLVTVLDEAKTCGGASGGSFGWINANFAESPAYFALRCAAMDEYRRLAQANETNRVDLQCAGGLWWEKEGDALEQHYQTLAGYGYAVEKINAAQFAELEPSVATPPAQCLYSRVERAVDVRACAETFLRAARRHGATIKTNCRAIGFHIERGEVAGVKIPNGMLRADVVVVAAGASAQSLLTEANIPLPMDNRAGIIIHTQPVEPIVRHIVFTPEIHFWQRDDGVLVVGETFSGDEVGDIDHPPGEADALADDILRRITRMLPKARNLKAERVTRRMRPLPADGFPAVGAPAGLKGLYVASMHSGVTLAPLIGKLAAREILHNQAAELLEPFRLSRFAPAMTKTRTTGE